MECGVVWCDGMECNLQLHSNSTQHNTTQVTSGNDIHHSNPNKANPPFNSIDSKYTKRQHAQILTSTLYSAFCTLHSVLCTLYKVSTPKHPNTQTLQNHKSRSRKCLIWEFDKSLGQCWRVEEAAVRRCFEPPPLPLPYFCEIGGWSVS